MLSREDKRLNHRSVVTRAVKELMSDGSFKGSNLRRRKKKTIF